MGGTLREMGAVTAATGILTQPVGLDSILSRAALTVPERWCCPPVSRRHDSLWLVQILALTQIRVLTPRSSKSFKCLCYQ